MGIGQSKLTAALGIGGARDETALTLELPPPSAALQRMVPDLLKPETDALALAARARVQVREEALQYQEEAMRTVAAATQARRAAARAREALGPLHLAMDLEVSPPGEEVARRFLGGAVGADGFLERSIRRLLREQQPSPPLYLPPMVAVSPCLDPGFLA
mmetsp:Transcript_124784/g.358376  ORF Transcript_124784/g.358376 Transcript_124784/m.358376 type:complete len:160 (+) Transcript_124784:206-685(+)